MPPKPRTPGPKEAQVIALRAREQNAKPRKVHGLAAINADVLRRIEQIAPAKPAGEQQESDVKTATAKKAPAKAKKTKTGLRVASARRATRDQKKQKAAAKRGTVVIGGRLLQLPTIPFGTIAPTGLETEAASMVDFGAANIPGPVPAKSVAEFICRPKSKDNPKGGASMKELETAFKIEAHPMRAKIYFAKHTLGYAIEHDGERYQGTRPKAKAKPVAKKKVKAPSKKK